MKTKQELIKLGLDEMQADKVMLLESAMLENAIKFQFKKKDGSIRDAVGTLVRARMITPEGKIWDPKGVNRRPEQPHLLNYWDCVVQDWRSVNMFNLISVEA